MDEYFQLWVFSSIVNVDAFWQNWLEENTDKRSEVEEARATLLRMNFSKFEMAPAEVSIVWSRIRKSDIESIKKPNPFKPKLFVWYGAVAAMLIVGFGSFFWTSSHSITEYRTAFGETKTIVLPDSSTVILNSNSSLRLSNVWELTAPREVWLDGEAFFSVIHKKNNQPFKVKTGEDVAIEVLGTTFNVYHRGQTKIVLNSGSIQLSLPTVKADEKIMMKPGELVEYDEKKYTKRTVDPKVYTAWTEKNLVLNRTSLRELLSMIKDNYGIDVEVKASLLDQTISGSMPVTDSDGLLIQIAKAFQLRIIKEEDKILLKEESRQDQREPK